VGLDEEAFSTAEHGQKFVRDVVNELAAELAGVSAAILT